METEDMANAAMAQEKGSAQGRERQIREEGRTV